ncbi:MAG TPA: ABC transporter permease [Candidatus Angelobacter sp.]|nr:ABC transporter permease [Candidatus Angelobacter sp.]
MNWKTFTAMLARDAHVARRNAPTLFLQVLLQPLLFVFIFGQVMVRSGMMNASYKSMLLPGIMAMAMLMTGVTAVSMPIIMELLTKEIEDRLLAPMDTKWLAVEKVVAGMLQSLVAGSVVLPAAWLLLGRNIGITFTHPIEFAVIMLLIALLAAAGGLAMGCSVGQTHIGLLFSMVLAPMIMFGCAYYPWSALKSFPILQMVVLINPLVYASEGLRGTLAPHVPHMPVMLVIAVLALADLALIAFSLNRFQRKTIG